MKKFRINWLVVMRNIVIIMFLIMCNKANAQNKIINEQINYVNEKIDVEEIVHLEIEEEPEIMDEPERVYLGRFKITHYCACTKCCGKYADGITASGKKVEEGKTIAVDKNVISLGSKVFIEDYGEYEAQDTGSAIKGNRIDVYVSNHEKALQLGVVYKDVYLIK